MGYKTVMAWLLATLPSSYVRGRFARASLPFTRTARRNVAIWDGIRIFSGIGFSGLLGTPIVVKAIGAEKILPGTNGLVSIDT